MEGRESMVVSPAPAPPPPTGMTAGPDMYQRAHSGAGGSSAMAAAAPVLRQHSMSSPMGVSIASNNANANAVSSPPYQHHPHQHQHQHHGSEQHQNQHQHHGGDVMVSHGMNMGMGGNPLHRMEPLKRKRGRPRKYGPDGNMALALAPLSAAPSLFSPSSKRGRGRPPGSGKKQQLAALGTYHDQQMYTNFGSAGIGFTPHVITIASGEDVASKIMSFSQQGPRAVCILSANGAISNVTLRQPATSGGTVTYEGRFEILSLSGSFLLTENGGTRSRTGGLSVTLAGPDGRIVGGGVAGLLMAASPVQVVVGSFLSSCRKPQQRPPESSSGMPQANAGGAATVSSPVSRGTMSESSGGPGSPMNQSTGDFNSAPSVPSQPMQSMPSYQSMAWPASQPMGEQRRSTDINMSLPAG